MSPLTRDPVRVVTGLALATIVAACASAPRSPYVSDARPGVDAENLECVRLLAGLESGIGSAVAIAPDLLLTARHVVDPLRGDRAGRSGEWFPARVGFDRVQARVVAAGEMNRPHGDWAVLQVDRPTWPADRVAVPHPPALDPQWRPRSGSEVLFAGYATGFFGARGVDPRRPAPLVATRVCPADGLESEGEAWFGEDRGMELEGMSGGAAFVWNARARRLELIGVFVGQTSVRTEASGLFGIRIGLGTVRGLRFVRLPAAAILRSDHDG